MVVRLNKMVVRLNKLAVRRNKMVARVKATATMPPSSVSVSQRWLPGG